MTLTLREMAGKCGICSGLPTVAARSASRHDFHRGASRANGTRDLEYDKCMREYREHRGALDPVFALLVEQHRSAGWL